MFGLGSKKSSGQPWNIVVLTSDYLIEGVVQPEDYDVDGDDLFALAAVAASSSGGLTAFQHLRLTTARVRPTGNLSTPEQTFAEWSLPNLDEVVAIVPGEAGSLKAAQAAFKDYRHPFEAMVYAGPYRLRAKLLADTANLKQSPFAMTPLLPLAQAVIDCHLPGARLTGYQVPWLLLNGGALHGFGLL